MRTLLALTLAVALSSSAFSSAYFAPREEMILSADIIAVVDITDVRHLEPEKVYGNQEARAIVERALKGDLVDEAVFFVPCFFPCAITQVDTGRHIVFLRRGERRLEGCNWHLSYRPISGSVVEWYGADDEYQLEERLLDDAIAEIADVVSRVRGGGPPATGPSRAAGEPFESAVELIRAATTRPWPGEGYPALPSLSTEMRERIADEIAGSDRVRAAYAKLDAARRQNNEWFEGVAELETERAVWSVASCLIHPHEDVQIRALRALRRLDDRRVVSFLVTYAEYMAVWEGGSENATIHRIIHESVAATLSALTGVRIEIGGQDPDGLKRGIAEWRKWLAAQPGTDDG